MEIPHHVKYKKSMRISQWKNVYKLKLREGETYEMIYDKVQNTKNCQLCNVELCDGVKSNGRCMDHCHETHYFRMVLCRKCNSGHKRELQKNNTTGIKGLSHRMDSYSGRWCYRFKRDVLFSNKNKQITLWYKYVYMLLQR